MKKKLLLLFAVLAMAVSASAYDFEVDGIYYNGISLQDLTCEVTYGDNKYFGDIVIPSTVTYCGKTISVTSIGDNAFDYCKSLTSVEIPNSVTSIGGSAFRECSSLTLVKIGNSVTSIGYEAFSWCSSLTSVVIPNSVTEIGGYAFYYCTSLTSVEIPNSVTSIGDYAFQYCSSLTSVTIGNSVTSIGNHAFQYCTDLTLVTIGNSVTSIGFQAFSSCRSLTSVVIPNSVTSIDSYAFSECSSLTSVEIPNSVTSIGNHAFGSCRSLTSVTIPSSVETIGERAFYGCENLTSVTIGNSVTQIGYQAFSYCSNLKDITSLPVTPPSIYENTFEGISKAGAIVKVPNESVVAYQAADYWKLFWNIVGLNGEGGGTEPETKQCAAPTIELVDGKLVATSTTEGATCYTSIKTDDYKGVDSNEPIELTGVYNISSYAHADGYQNSETVTATLVWVNPTLEGSSVMSMEAKKAVLIRTQSGSIIVSGTERGEGIQLYTIDGQQLRSVSAEDGETVIPYTAGKGEMVIVKYGGKAVKVLIR